MADYAVLLISKQTIHVKAKDESEAIEKANKMIHENEGFKRFRTGWKIEQANEC